MKLEIETLINKLNTSKKLVFVCHKNPDGDAYGSTLALYHFFKRTHQVTVLSPNDCPLFLKWLPGQSEIVIFDKETDKATKILKEADLVFTLDFNAFHRAGSELETVLASLQTQFVMIDHHQEPDNYANYMFSNVTKSSTCEMVYDFIEILDKTDKITKDIATCIYTGIMTDTGSFRFPLTTARTHYIAANLIEKGIENSKIYNRINDTNTENRIKLLGRALQNLVVVSEYKTAYISLSQEELDQNKFQKGDTEGFVNYALSLKGIVFAVIFIEDTQQKIIKMSLRSKGDFKVNEFSKKYYHGGGHNNAAGGRSEDNLKNTISKFLTLLPKYKTQLLNAYEE